MRRLTLLLSCLLLQACTQTEQGLQQSLVSAVTGPQDITLTPQQIADTPYASLYARINHGPRIFVVLAFNEAGSQKWVTADEAMLATVHGRLVKTLGLKDNLQDVSNLAQDPLAQGLTLAEGAQWTRIIQWQEQGKVRADTATSRFHRLADSTLDIAGQQVPCRVWQESVTLSATQRQWHNTFWIDNRSGEVVQAQQTLAADDFPVETTLLKPAKS